MDYQVFNDQVSKLHFGNRIFTLKFPSIDHIIDKKF